MCLDRKIAKMEVSDLGEVIEIDVASRLTPWSRQSFLEELRNPFAYCFTLKRIRGPDDQAIGFICFRIVKEESELLILAIHPHYRQRGLGKKLMTFYVDFCSERKIKTFYLDVGVSNQPAIRLYQSFAYQPIGRRSKFYQGREDALLMMRRA
jgi:ribosomal-protein-alanine N-acetyltransferase